MRVYIHTDLEGASGIGEAIVDGENVVIPGTSKYKDSVSMLIGDVNAAVDGAFEGGATHVTVLDSHGGGNNFTAEEISGSAEYDPKENKLWFGKLDSSYDATFFIGAHAMAGTLKAFLDHTQSSTEWFNARINGRRFGELGQWAMVAAEFGVPLVMVSGDEAACAEAREFVDPVETAVVKRGIKRFRAECLPIDESRNAVCKAARDAMKLIGEAKPLSIEKPIRFELTLSRTDICDKMLFKDIERVDARTIRWVRQNGFGVFPWYPPMTDEGKPIETV